MAPSRTAVVVGSGPNGLAAAVRLAQAGLSVTVYEAAAEVGGGTRSGELMVPDVVHDHCSAFHPLGVASPFLRSLPLARHGLRWRWPRIDCAHPLDDGTAGLFYRDIDVTAEGLGPDGPRWKALFGRLADRFDDIGDDILRPIARLPRHPITLARFGARALMPATTLSDTMATPQARALFAGIAAHAFTRLDRPGSSAAGVMLVAAGHRSGWPVAEGGSGAIAAALTGLLGELGATIHVGTPIERFGEVADADVVMLDVAPETAADLLGPAMPRRISRAFTRIGRRAAAHKVDYVIEGEVGWTAPGCAEAGTVHLGGHRAEIVATERHVLSGRMPQRPFTLVGQQWLADPDRAAGTLRPLWAYAHVPAGYDGPVTDLVTTQIERFAPGFASRIVDLRARTPRQLAVDNANYRSGDIGGGPNDLWHLLARPRLTPSPYSTGVAGVYLCSSATPPGGGVHGMCGFHAATAALRDLDRPRRSPDRSRS